MGIPQTVYLKLVGKKGRKMEQVYVIAVKSFINGVAGSVTRKQRLPLPKNLAAEFVAMGLVEYDNPPKKQQPVTDAGEAAPSVSLPAETASQTTTSQKPNPVKRGKR